MKNLREKGHSNVRRFLLERKTLFSSPEMPQQQSYPFPPWRASSGSGYSQQRGGYPQQGETPLQQDYPQQSGINPWIAGGLQNVD